MAQKGHRFYKIFVYQKNAEKMGIPSKFCKKLAHPLPNKMILNVDGEIKSWPVKVVTPSENNNKCYLVDGWENFVRDNSSILKPLDLLVFTYDGGHKFEIKILGPSGSYISDDEEKDDNVHNQHETLDKFIVSKNVESVKKVIDQRLQLWNKSLHIRRVDPHEHEIFSRRLALKPNSIYFVTKINLTRPYDLFIPMYVTKHFQYQLPNEPYLIDPEWRRWQTKLKIWRCGRALYNGGWFNLCVKNLIGINDTCICEFVKSDKEGLDLDIKVYIVRSNS